MESIRPLGNNRSAMPVVGMTAGASKVDMLLWRLLQPLPGSQREKGKVNQSCKATVAVRHRNKFASSSALFSPS